MNFSDLGRVKVLGKWIICLLPCLFLGLGCQDRPPAEETSPLTFSDNSPGQCPRFFRDAQGKLYLSWVRMEENVAHFQYMARSGAEQSQPVTVASGQDWFVNQADRPGIAAAANGNWYAWWLKKTENGPEGHHIMLAKSTDSGMNWSEGIRLHKDSSATEHGFLSAVSLPDSSLGFLWLDGHAYGKNPDSAAMSLRFRQAEAPESEVELDGRVCDCCGIASTQSGNGPLMLYRDRSEGEIRDISLRKFRNGQWSSAYMLGGEGWKIRGCPVNGPALSHSGNAVCAAWYSGANAKSRIMVALSSDGGNTFPGLFKTGSKSSLGQVDLIPDSRPEGTGKFLLSWLETEADSTVLLLQSVGRKGPEGPIRLLTGLKTVAMGDAPRLAMEAGELQVIWTSGKPGAFRLKGKRGGPEAFPIWTGVKR